jgi:hypothetical protein
MVISRSQMGSQLTGNRKMKKTKKMNKGGDLINMLSPAAALFNTVQSGSPQGIMNLSPLAHMLGQGGRKGGAAPEEEAVAAIASSGPMQRPELATRGMKKGGKVRGDGICQRGRTKGTMR